MSIRSVSRSKFPVFFFVLTGICACFFSIGCRQGTQDTADQISARNLVESFDKDWLSSDRERFMFNDRTIKRTILGDGWTFDANISTTLFPWPRFTSRGGSVFLEWNHLMERRIIVKLVNIASSYSENLVSATLNDETIPFIENDLPVGEYEFYIPSSLQSSGRNTLHLSINTDHLPPGFPLESIGLHSIRVTLGAVVRSRIQIGDQVRNSLLFAPPVKLRIPVRSGHQKNIQFSYGLYSTAVDTAPASYSLDLTLYESTQNRLVFEKTYPITRDKMTQTRWQAVREKLPMLHYDGFLEVSFHADSELAGPIDYLALSEFLLSPAQVSWDLSIQSSQPDVLLITLSSVSAGQLGAYGNQVSITPFLDRLSRYATVYTDTMSVSNSETASTVSLVSGKFPRDHGFYRDFPKTHELPALITDPLKDTPYQSHVFAYTSIQPVFAKMHGFRRVYLSRPGTDPMDTVRNQLDTILNSPLIIANPGFFWFHLAPEILTENDTEKVFDPAWYHDTPVPVTELNLPVSEQDRLTALISSGDSDNDTRVLLARIDHRLLLLDRMVHDIFQDIAAKRHKRSLFFVITADHGLIRSLDSNLLSSDSLSQDVLHVPLMYGFIPADKTAAPARSLLAAQPASSIKAYEVLIDTLRKGGIDSVPANGSTASDRSLFAEHYTRPILAYRRDQYKLIHVFSNPYFQIATTNLFNLEDDPSESANLVGRDSEFTRSYLDTALAFCRGSPYYPRPRIGFEDEALAILKSLKYTD
jgi:hypothetical protein